MSFLTTFTLFTWERTTTGPFTNANPLTETFTSPENPLLSFKILGVSVVGKPPRYKISATLVGDDEGVGSSTRVRRLLIIASSPDDSSQESGLTSRLRSRINDWCLTAAHEMEVLRPPANRTGLPYDDSISF